MDKNEFSQQFSFERYYHLAHINFATWYRFFYIFREIIDFKPENILEIGEGSGVIRNCLGSAVKEYKTLDVNEKLAPDILSDVRRFKNELREKFQCVIAADILEHIPFSDFAGSIRNIFDYLLPGGEAVITIPHRRYHFLFMTSATRPHVLTIPIGFLKLHDFYSRFIRRKIEIDPHHCWEIGDGKIERQKIESIFKESGFVISKFKKLIYVDFWVLKKHRLSHSAN